MQITCGGGVYYTQLCVLFSVKFPKFAQNFNPLFNRLILNIGIAKVLKLLPVDLKWIFCEYLYEAKKGDGFFIKYHVSPKNSQYLLYKICNFDVFRITYVS